MLAVCLAGCGTQPEKIHPLDGLTYVWVAPGEFIFGCSRGDAECYPWEPRPETRKIEPGFWIGQTEVTQGAYKRVLGSNPSLHAGEARPVDQVSWNDAKRYCRELGLRLPTTVEWEYAARGGSIASRYGSVDQVGWYDANSGDATYDVKQKQANAFGLYDMLGNVWEWVENPWTGDPDKDQRQLRGGSFTGLAKDVRASSVNWADPGTAHRNMGFRCAADSMP